MLSFSRILLAFFLIAPIIRNDFETAALLFALAAVSDFLDGFCARKLKASSETGAMLDPLADKILITVSYLLFAQAELIPAYTAMVVIGRDLLILAAVLACKVSGAHLEIRPLMSSKINTAVQLIYIGSVIACKLLPIYVPYLPESFGIIVVVSTVFSGADYARRYRWIKDEVFKR
jgi:cardiolipin synthase